MCVRPSTAFYSGFSLGMGRSPGFGSVLCDYKALKRLRPLKARFPCGSAVSLLNLATPHNSPDRSTKSTRLRFGRAPTACRHRVSGSLSLPSRGSFHLSFTVLCAIGHWVVFSLGGWSPRLPTRFHVSRGTPDTAAAFQFQIRGFHPLWLAFPKPFSYLPACLCSPLPRGARAPV